MQLKEVSILNTKGQGTALILISLMVLFDFLIMLIYYLDIKMFKILS